MASKPVKREVWYHPTRRSLFPGNRIMVEIEEGVWPYEAKASDELLLLRNLISLQIKTGFKLEQLRKEIAREEGWV